jgi:catechol 2,3-dioxygenase-like lactoylglutathione lyase family enzyme
MPALTVGHVGVHARDLPNLTRFYREVVGLAQIVDMPGVIGIFELGDADFYVMPGEPGAVGFDIATGDLDALHARLLTSGVKCSDVAADQRTAHRHFEFTDPDGNVIGVCDAHPRNLAN